MEVKAKNISRGDKINIVSDNEELIANIILVSMCEFKEVADNEAYYETEYDFDIKDKEEITKYILQIASLQTFQNIHTVHIKTYYDGFPYNQISFYYYS